MTVLVVVTVTVTTVGAVVGVPDTVKVERVVGMTGSEGAAEVEVSSACLSAAMVACTLDRWPIVMVAIVGRANVPVNVTRVTESSSPSGCVFSTLRESTRAVTESSEALLILWFTNSTCPSTETLGTSLFLRKVYS